MSYVNDYFILSLDPAANKDAVVEWMNVRFTVLTPKLIRLEYSKECRFEDRPSMTFWYRNQAAPYYEKVVNANTLKINTEYLQLVYEGNDCGFSSETLSIKLLTTGTVWHYGDTDTYNLKGTVTCLDGADRRVELENGLVSRNGWSVVDDSNTSVINDDGWVEARFTKDEYATALETVDIYFFGYGTDYKGCLKDFCKLTGHTPLIPRWALGNWWSRYWPYTDYELKKLMEEFNKNRIPLSVCVMDLLWHVFENEYSSGWTGYTWNDALFPDPEGFLKWLHEKGLKTVLSIHPADGVYPHEKEYEKMAEFMGMDPEAKKPVNFDLTDPKYIKAYFEIMHHPHEEEGVDFWWIDWQQGSKSKIYGLSPLTWLNHVHFYDLGRDGRKRPFIFSRYGGLGSHRYPIGFSGDTFVEWSTLYFLPSFTSTAANVGYGWWSHDIGGHMGGIEDGELYTRWVQFGVFSPIMRLHSTFSHFHDRRPWAFGKDVLDNVGTALRLRHSLIPYLYTMAWRNHKECIPVVTPMYYEHSEDERSYTFDNQYYFGSELLAAPFNSPMDKDVALSRQVVWLPEGGWYHFFTGEYYEGGKIYAIYGDMNEIPVFAKEGAIIPMAMETDFNGAKNPYLMEVNCFIGKSNKFVLYEDDGETTAYKRDICAFTCIEQVWEDSRLIITLKVPKNEYGIIPENRRYKFKIWGTKNPEKIVCTYNDNYVEGIETEYDDSNSVLTLDNLPGSNCGIITITLSSCGDTLSCRRDRMNEKLARLLDKIKLDVWAKRQIEANLPAIIKDTGVLASIAQKVMTNYNARIDCRISASQMTAILETLKQCELTFSIADYDRKAYTTNN